MAVTLDRIREDLKKELQKDSEIHYVEVQADTLEEALNDAGIQLDTRVKNLEYEVEERGSAGVMGLAKKPWKIKVYQNAASLETKKKMTGVVQTENVETAVEEQKIVDKDGMYYIRHFGSEIMLKVCNPIGNGKAVSAKDIIDDARRSDTLDLDESAIKKYAAEGTNDSYEVIGAYNHDLSADALLAVDVSDDWMKATITVTNPGMSGSDISEKQIRDALATQGVLAGFEDDKIKEFVDNPIYNAPCEVAAAVLPVDGRDAYIKYEFETDKTKLKIKESENGQMDFKELNLIQNVIEGQALACKIPAEKGKPGKKLDGRYLETKDGRDINLPLGKNVKVDTDGVTIVATVNGQVLLVNDKINVEPIMELDGVNSKTGNISFLGTVIIKGNVEDGYKVTASGDIEVNGSVGNCQLSSDGNIVISQGVIGHDEGKIVAGKSVWAKFVNHTTIEAGENVVVNDSIMNSDVTAMKSILVRGKRAQITGGHLFATEEICAKNIGSNRGGAETILEVGFDPKAKQELVDLQSRQNDLVKELDDIDLNIATLETQKKSMRKLSIEKEENLNKLMERKNEILDESDTLNENIQTLQQHLRDLKVVGKVKASGTVFAGVKIFVRDVKDDVRTEVKSVTFYYEGGFVRRGKYEAPAADEKLPEGYSS